MGTRIMTNRTNRREFLKAAAAGASAAFMPMPAIAQGAGPRVVVVGGGLAGASCARALKKLDPRAVVTLIEASQTFTACPFSNEVVAGLRDLKDQQFDYAKIGADGVVLSFGTANTVDAQARAVTLADGTRRLASICAGTRCRATPKRPPSACRTPGRPASRPRFCAANSKPWRTAAWW